jgi:hypothetical protein
MQALTDKKIEKPMAAEITPKAKPVAISISPPFEVALYLIG